MKALISDAIVCVQPDGTSMVFNEHKITKSTAQNMLGGPIAVYLCGRHDAPGYFKNHAIVLRDDLNGPDALLNANLAENKALNEMESPIVDFIVNGPVLVGPIWCFEDLPGFEPERERA